MDILTLGHPKLHKSAEEVSDFGSQKLMSEIETLKSALQKFDGVGIAGPQLGINRCILIIHSSPNKRYPYAPKVGPLVLINPKPVS